jgi:hypothetical protein
MTIDVEKSIGDQDAIVVGVDEAATERATDVPIDSGDHTIPPAADVGEGSGEDFLIARDYLRQLQDRSMHGLAEWLVGSKHGVWHTDAEYLKAASERIRAHRHEADLNLGGVVPKFSTVIEGLCEKLKLPLRGGVACGAVYQPKDVPAQMPVLGTNASVIVIPEHSLMQCHYISKALAWGFPIEKEGERHAVSLRPKRILKKLRRDPTYLARAIAYCATHDGRCFAGLNYQSTAGVARVLHIELLLATEIFMVAHEYGHHIDDHRLGGGADVEGLIGDTPIIQELRADYLAALITAHFGATSCQPRNYWATSGVAAIIVLGAMDLVLRARAFLQTGVDRVRPSDTHPPMMVRLLAVDRLNRRYDPRERVATRNSRRNIRHVMTSLWDLIQPELRRLRDRGIRPLPLCSEEAQWLP